MINFFRRIRQQLLGEGKTGKYFKYAIGEILLVMIGILLALQVNNWNEERKSDQSQYNYLSRLYEDLSSDSIYLQTRIKKAQKYINDTRDYIKQSYDHQGSFDEYLRVRSFLRFDTEEFEPQNIVFNELQNTGTINLIKNLTLKESIISLYHDYELVSNHITEINYFSTRELSKIIQIDMKYWVDYNFLQKINEPLIFSESEMLDNSWEYIDDQNSPEFRLIEGTAAFFIYKHYVLLRYFNDLLKKIVEVRSDLRSELNH